VAEALRFLIRDGTEADLPALEWEGQYRRYRKVYRLAMQEARRGARALLLAEVGETVVGQIFLQFESPFRVPGTDRVGYLYAFRVRPGYRGQGIGQALLAEAERRLIRVGALAAVIAVARDNADARRLYERVGYTWLTDDPGEWSYVDETGMARSVQEPAYLLWKPLVGETPG
jgi:ribosomal protein S18 acetylase RimI-like enzyme